MKVLRLSTGYRCPLKCRSCYAPNNLLRMSRGQITAVIAAAAAEGFGSLALGGGEPLYMLDDTVIAVREASKWGMTSAITTSGYGLNRGVLGRLEEAGLDHVQLSMGDNRVNLPKAYDFIKGAERKCSFGINFLMSPTTVSFLPAFVRRFDADGAGQIVLLTPKGVTAPARFSLADFARYYAVLRALSTKSAVICVDCATQEALTGSCSAEGCSFFPDGTVSRCAFGCGPRVRWTGSFEKAMACDSGHCGEGRRMRARIDGLDQAPLNLGQTSGGLEAGPG